VRIAACGALMVGQLLLLGVGVLLILGTAVFVAAEFSLVTVDRAQVAQQAAAGDARSKALLGGLKSLSTQLSGAQVGITVTTLALGYVMEPSLAAIIAGPLEHLGLASGAAESVAVVLALVVATVLSMVFGELVPKNLAVAEPLATAKAVVTTLRVSTWFFRPLIWVLNGVANGVLRVFFIEPQEELRSARSQEELQSLVRRSAAQGTLAQPTAGLLSRSISFSGKTAADVLTPRTRVHFVRATESANAVLTAAGATGHSRFPVSGADSDDVVGLVHLKRALSVAPEERSVRPVEQLMVQAPVVPASTPLDDLLDLLRGQGLQMAVVTDEYGGTAGILTLEDVVEELVGEISDEHDSRDPRAARQYDDTWLLPGDLRPDEIAEITGVSLPESGAYETVAGLVMARLGRLPDPADTVEVAATMLADAELGVLGVAVPGSAEDEPISMNELDDLPRVVEVRLTVAARARRRVESVVLSAVRQIQDRGEVR
jgi:CBS domain containing-hemolysin-like protein